MANRQYIGARYVPKIFNNNGSNEWVSGIAYEPLTIVTYLNNSYTSCKPVPSNAGAPNVAIEYWANTGNVSAIISSLTEEVNTLEETVGGINTRLGTAEGDIDKLEINVNALKSPYNRTYLVLTDSYGNYTNESGRNFIREAFYTLGITNYYEFHRGSAGFCREGELNFLDVLQDNESSITNKNAITDIIVAGGANDQYDPTLTDAGISAFVTYVKTNYPNAKIYITHFTNSIDPTWSPSLYPSIIEYRKCSKYGVEYVENSEYVMRNIGFFNTDMVHPNTTGIAKLAKYFADFIVTGRVDVYEESKEFLTALTGFTLNNNYILQVQHNNIIQLTSQGAGGAMNFSSSSDFVMAEGQTMNLNMFQSEAGYLYAIHNYDLNIMCVFFNENQHIWVAELVASKPNSNTAKLGLIVNNNEQTSITIPANTNMHIRMNTFTFGLDLG